MTTLRGTGKPGVYETDDGQKVRLMEWQQGGFHDTPIETGYWQTCHFCDSTRVWVSVTWALPDGWREFGEGVWSEDQRRMCPQCVKTELPE